MDNQARTTDYPIDPAFLNRWSPRSFTGEAIGKKDLETMVEAARWAASSYNVQPWRFIYALRGTEHFDTFLGLLFEYNKVWAKHASAIVVLVSNSKMTLPDAEEPTVSYSHTLDAGAASGYFTLQAAKLGWSAHGMVGFDMARATAALGIPADYRVEAAYAIGKMASPDRLPEALREREFPSPRLPLSEILFEGKFGS